MPSLVHWNPYRRLARSGPLRVVRLPSRVNNFGDLLGPVIVRRLLERLQLPVELTGPRRLLSVGSILHMSRERDVVWGSGVNGKIRQERFPSLDVRAVRGPLTARALRRSGNVVPAVFGDPALLLPHLWTTKELGIRPGSGGTVYVPNLHDRASFPPQSLDPRGDPLEKVARIASAERVVASSLHGIIVAEAFSVPVAIVASPSEPSFKYEDYFEGTGRRLPSFSSTWREAVASTAPALSWDPRPLLDAFPADLWHGRSRTGGARA
jgi:pyruvyltransferase